MLKNNPDNCSARLLKALVYEKEGALDKASDMATAVAVEYPDSFAALYTCGRLRAKFPLQRRNAYQTLSNAYMLDRDNTAVLVSLCNLGTELKYKNVLQYINALKAKPEYANNNILNYQLGKCLLLHGKKREALAAFKAALSKLSDFELLFNIARTVDNYQLDRKYATRLYRVYLMAPTKQRTPEAIAYAKRRIQTLGN